MGKNYTVTLYANPEPILDIEEFECICQQMAAIQNGYGHDFGQVFVQEEVEDNIEYVWEKNQS